jgi:transcriptional regulator with XRE-family HTH domain
MISLGHEPNPAKRIRLAQGSKLRALREFRGWTLRVLAEKMSEQEGISVTSAAISEWERGVSTPRQHMQVAVARALDTPWASVFSLDERASA